MAHCVQKVGTCPAYDILDVTLRNTVLRLGRDTAERVYLRLLVTVVLEGLGREDSIVGVVFLDSKSSSLAKDSR